MKNSFINFVLKRSPNISNFMITKKKTINWINQTNRNKTNKAKRINNMRSNWKFLKKSMKKCGKYLTKDFINKVNRNCNKRQIYLNF